MKNFILLCFYVTSFIGTSSAQTRIYPVASFGATPPSFAYLLQKNSTISQNDTVHELIVDLVQPMLLDSAIERKKQHHKLAFLGWFIHAFGGYNWRAISMEKQKFVGTVHRHTRSSEEEFTEYDINFDLYFNTPFYLRKVFEAYDLQRKTGRQDIRKSHRTDYSVPPFVRDTTAIDKMKYRLHCELTPARQFRDRLHDFFYPTRKNLRLEDHENFGTNKPTMGMYGTWCMDCNHSCHPELHPYEWVWWLRATDKDESTDKVWLTGLFHEGSNRMKKWSNNPMTGSLKIPFIINLNDSVKTIIRVEHLVTNVFKPEELQKVPMPENTFGPEHKTQPVRFTYESNATDIEVQFNSALYSKGLRYWFSDLNFDKKDNWLSGYFHMAVSADELYTSRITFTTQHGN